MPLFTFYGLERGAFLGTEAAELPRHVRRQGRDLPGLGRAAARGAAAGLVVGATLMAGSFVGRFVVLRLCAAAYRSLIDGLMAVFGRFVAVGRVSLIGSARALIRAARPARSTPRWSASTRAEPGTDPDTTRLPDTARSIPRP